MDSIKKKMNSLRTETLQMQDRIQELEEETAQANKISDQCDHDVREIGKRISAMETAYDEAFNAKVATEHKLEDKEKALAICDQDISSLCRRLTLLETEDWTAETRLGKMTIDLANTCRQADEIQRKVRSLEAKCMNNEANIEDLEKLLSEARNMYQDSDKKLDESTRRLGVIEEELKRGEERAAASESNIKRLEGELKAVGDNMKALEVAEEKALAREEKFKEQIRTLVTRLKSAESRIEYGEMNITKLNHRVDDIEDEIVREKLKIEKVGNEVGQTLDDIFTKY